MPNLLELDSIHTFIGQFHILEGISLSVPQGGITALLGRNGAGKTTTLKSIIGLTPPRTGSVKFDGVDVRGKRAFDIACLGIGYVPEHRAIFRDLTVLENLKIAERAKHDFEKREEMLFNLFPDLKRLITLSGGQLSGGQQQMLAIARALVPRNRLLLIDEPSEGLAPVIIEQLMEAMRALTSNVTVLLVEQNFRVASQLADHYYLIDDGHSVQHGAMRDLVNDRATVQKYLGAKA